MPLWQESRKQLIQTCLSGTHCGVWPELCGNFSWYCVLVCVWLVICQKLLVNYVVMVSCSGFL